MKFAAGRETEDASAKAGSILTSSIRPARKEAVLLFGRLVDAACMIYARPFSYCDRETLVTIWYFISVNNCSSIDFLKLPRRKTAFSQALHK
jgi:hypothetical protein